MLCCLAKDTHHLAADVSPRLVPDTLIRHYVRTYQNIGSVHHCVCTYKILSLYATVYVRRTKRQKDKHVFALSALPSVTQ